MAGVIVAGVVVIGGAVIYLRNREVSDNGPQPWPWDNQSVDLKNHRPIPYLSLPSTNSMRVLVLLPGKVEDPICCQLRCFGHAATPRFEALSYQWGDPHDKRAIFVDGVKVAVTRSLYGALAALRKQTTPRQLWVDAICINQEDVVEKAAQVNNMAYIYQRAEAVIVYLGEHLAFNNFHNEQRRDRVQQAVTKAVSALRFTNDKETSSSRERKIKTCITNTTREVKFDEMAMDYFLWHLVHNEYWKRGWIIQEIIMAPHKLMVSFGSDIVCWDKFITWINWYHQLNPQDEAVQFIFQLNELRESRTRTGSVITLSSLLETFRDSFTSYQLNGVHHDKIYSLVGLAHDVKPGTFSVDYQKSAAQIYKDCIDHFWHHSSLTPRQRSIELPHYSALVRRLLVRTPVLDKVDRGVMRTFSDKGPRYTFDWDGKPMKPVRGNKSADLENMKWENIWNYKQVNMSKWLIQSELHKPKYRWLWKTTKVPEDASLWSLGQAVTNTVHFFIRGLVIDQVEHVGHPSQNESVPLPPPYAFPNALHFKGAQDTEGFGPATTQSGDLICRFWNTEATALVRPRTSSSSCDLVGRVYLRGASTKDEVSLQLNAEVFGLSNEKAIDVPATLDQVTQLTLDTIQ